MSANDHLLTDLPEKDISEEELALCEANLAEVYKDILLILRDEEEEQ